MAPKKAIVKTRALKAKEMIPGGIIRDIQQISVEKLLPYEKNAKIHKKEQVSQVAASIKEFGFAQPIVVDKNMVVIVGHGRLEAAKLLQMETVPVIVLDVTEEQAKAYRLADNKLNESEWDMKLVIEELKGLTLPMLELTGFDKDLLLDNDDKDDQVGGLPDKGKTTLGEVWQCGPHRLMVGDSTKSEDVKKLMDKNKADMVFTDPPYNVDYSGSAKKSATKKILNDNMTDEGFEKLLVEAFANFKDNVKGGAGLYVFHSPTTQAVFEKALRENNFEVKYQLIWNKPSAGLGMGDYRAKHEPFFYCGVKGQKIQFYGDHTNTSVWDFAKSDEDMLKLIKRAKRAEAEGKTTIWTMKREPTGEYVHPTQKPVELITYALVNSSKTGDIVLDLFLGSGATMIAAEKAGRVCYGCELDPRYADVILDRYKAYTGVEPVRESDHMAWSEM